jgi:hypothetical protein
MASRPNLGRINLLGDWLNIWAANLSEVFD